MHKELSRTRSDARISLWCNRGTDMLAVEVGGLDAFEGIHISERLRAT